MPTDNPRVLVVDDEQALADLYSAWLADSYEVQTAYTGEDAVEKLDQSVDVVLLDRRMPSISGDEVLEEIREQELGCRVVIVSAVTPDFDIIGMGFDDYLTKPIEADDLLDAVDRMLARAEYDKQMQEYQQLVVASAILETEKSERKLRENEKYADLQDRLSEVATAVDSNLAEFMEDDFEAAFHDLDQTGGSDSSESDTSGETHWEGRN